MIQPGTAVIIEEGVMQGVPATVLIADNDCVLLSIQLLSGPILATIDVDGISVKQPLTPSRQVEH